MKLLIVAATAFEIKPLLDHFCLTGNSSGQAVKDTENFCQTTFLITGIGMVATAYFLGQKLAKEEFDLVINAGIAGSFNPSIGPGTVVNVVEDDFPEFGAEDKNEFLSVFDLGFYKRDQLPFTNGKLMCQYDPEKIKPLTEHISDLPRVSSITSNTIRGNKASIEKIKRRFPADIETMEGAAFFFGCRSSEVSCLQIRSISNYVEERNKSNWQTGLAVRNLNKFLLKLIH